MDIQILLSAGVPFICFIFFLPIVFRVCTESKSTSGMLYTAAVGLLVSIVIWVYGAALHMQLALTDICMGGIYVVSMYTLLILLFLFGVFSLFEASLTLRFLLEIAQVKKGITNRELISYYGVEKIIQRRLDRMIASGDIIRSGNLFTLSGRQSYFRFREQLLFVICYLFP